MPEARRGVRRNARYTVLDADGPRPGEMVRGARQMLRDPLAWLEGAVRTYGDLVALPLPRTPVLLVNTPAGARRVLQDNHPNYTKQTVQYGALSLVTGGGLLTADGDAWRRHRRVVQPAFHHGGLARIAEATGAAAEALRQEWAAAAGGVLDADAATLRAMLAVVGRTLFADDLAGPGDRVVAAVDDALRVVISRARSPFGNGPLGRLPTPSRRRLRRAVGVLDEVCAQVVARRRARGVADTDGDLLAVLLRAAGPDGLSDTEIRDELVTLVIAGHETVASSLAWTLHLLARHPQVQDELHAELDAVLGDAGGHRAPAWSDVHHLIFTRALIEESLRLYPPAWVITRRASAADVIDTVAVPAGTLLLISPWLLHRRDETWPDPQRFDPKRFMVDAEPAAGGSRRRAGYLPFGAGPRLCIGRDVALVETVLVLAALLRDRTVTPAGPAPGVDALVTLRPRGGLPLRLVPRA